MPIGLFFGQGDLFVSPGDYVWLKDQLRKKNNCAFFKEYDLGHIGLVIPKEKSIFMDMLALLMRHTEEASSKLKLPVDVEKYMRAEQEVEQIMSQMKE